MGKVLDRPYAMDYYTWPQAQAGALRRLAAERADLPLDLDHLAEEVEEFGKSERRAVRSQMRRLLEHLLKLQYATATESGAGWRRSIVDARIELADNLTPLHRDLEADLADLYEAAREQTAEALRDRTRRGAEAARALSVDVVGGAAGGAFRSGLDRVPPRGVTELLPRAFSSIGRWLVSPEFAVVGHISGGFGSARSGNSLKLADSGRAGRPFRRPNMWAHELPD